MVAGRDVGASRYAVRGVKRANAVRGNVKGAISGCYHAIKRGNYERRCLAEARYRFGRTFRFTEMLPRLTHAIMRCNRCREPSLHLAYSFKAENRPRLFCGA